MKRVRKALLITLLCLAGLTGVWLFAEDLWDRSLFGSGTAQNLHTVECRALLESEPGILVLDVRSEQEQSLGAIPNSVLLTKGSPAYEEFLDTADRDQPILVYCMGGMRSRFAVMDLKQHGFTRIYHLHRGYLAW